MARKAHFPAADRRVGCSFRKYIAAMLCLCLLALSGCTDLSFESADEAPAALPTPDTSAMTAPTGDSRARYSLRTTLYYRTTDGQLSSALRLIHVDPEDDPLRLVMESLLETPYSSSGLLPIAPDGTRLNAISFSSGVATVDLNAEALSQGEEYFYLARAAIAKTLLGLDQISAVNVLVEGRAAETGGMPLGALTQQDSNAAMGYIQQLSEQVLFESEGGFIERNIILYLPVSQGSALLPVNAAVRLESEDYLPALIAAFSEQAAGSLFPQELLGQISAETGITAAGERVLTIRLPEALSACSPADRLIPALSCTLCAFVPNVDAVRAFIGQQAVLSAGGVSADENGLFEPELFRSLIGSSAQLFFMAEDGSLVKTTHVLPGYSPSARALLAGLIAGPSECDPAELQAVFPENTLAQDILGVRIEDGTAHLNLSSALYSACQSLSGPQERALVYSIVNTLVYNLETVLRVQFYIDGAVADTFAGTISIRTPLMANPGLVQD